MRKKFPINLRVRPTYKTKLGKVFCCDSVDVMNKIPSESVDLILTSPPFPLIRKKSYGNEEQDKYVDWFINNFSYGFKRILKDTGSLVLDLGGTWNPGYPTRSLYQYELLIRMCNEVGFHLAQEFYWYNPAKMPSPAQWVTIERIRVKDSVNTVWWLSKTERPKSDNRRVLTPYKPSMRKLFKQGYNDGLRPSGHNVSKQWGENLGGAIPPNLVNYPGDIDNLLEIANTSSRDRYLEACRHFGAKPHPARFPRQLPQFFIEFLTEPGDLIYDPFGGSCMTGFVAEELERHWLSSEIDPSFVELSRYRFVDIPNRPTETGAE